MVCVASGQAGIQRKEKGGDSREGVEREGKGRSGKFGKLVRWKSGKCE